MGERIGRSGLRVQGFMPFAYMAHIPFLGAEGGGAVYGLRVGYGLFVGESSKWRGWA